MGAILFLLLLNIYRSVYCMNVSGIFFYALERLSILSKYKHRCCELTVGQKYLVLLKQFNLK